MKQAVVGMVGAGRASELHMGGYSRVSGVPVRLKKITDMRRDQLLAAREKYGFEEACPEFEELLRDPEINLIDICTPPYTHADMAIRALKAGKNVICEKPMTGYFGLPGDQMPIGDTVPKRVMFERMQDSIRKLEEAVKASGRHFMYAENFVYAPSIQRAADLIRQRQSKILYIKGEESLKGSSSPVAGEWSKTGGGSLMRVGSHPLGAGIYLKQVEAAARGESIRLDSVVCDCARVTPSLDEYEHRAISARPRDVEDTCTMVLSFSDGTRCAIIANDTLLGGSRNYVELYCNDAVINCKLTLADMLETYLPDDNKLEDFSLSEMLPVKTGWNRAFVADEIMRGYTGEIQDFVECAAYDREPQSDFRLACDTTLAMYAAYWAADEGRRVKL